MGTDTNGYRRISRRQPSIPANYQPTTMELTSLLIRERRAPNSQQTAARYISRLALTALSDLHTAISRLEDFYKSLGQPAFVVRLSAWGQYVFDKLTTALATEPSYTIAD